MNFNPLNILASGTAAKPGQVFLANEGSVDNQFLSEALTQYSVGWKSPDGKLEATLRALTGEPIIVPKRFSFKKMDNAKAFAAVENDEDVRAIGADFKRKDFTLDAEGYVVSGRPLTARRILAVKAAIDADGVVLPKPDQYEIFVTYMGEHRLQAFDLVQKMRRSGIRADLDHCGRSLMAQFKYANKTGAPLTAVIGDEEAANGNVKIKNMATGEEATVAVSEACEKVRAMIG